MEQDRERQFKPYRGHIIPTIVHIPSNGDHDRSSNRPPLSLKDLNYHWQFYPENVRCDAQIVKSEQGPKVDCSRYQLRRLYVHLNRRGLKYETQNPSNCMYKDICRCSRYEVDPQRLQDQIKREKEIDKKKKTLLKLVKRLGKDPKALVDQILKFPH
jgi:hypothetical protein